VGTRRATEKAARCILADEKRREREGKGGRGREGREERAAA